MLCLAIGLSMTAQTVTGDVIKSKNRVEFRGYKIEQIQNDTSLPSNSIMKLPTEYAVRQYVLNRLGGAGGGGVQDTTLAGDVIGGINSNFVRKINGTTVENKVIQAKEVLQYDGTKWTPDSIDLLDLPNMVTSTLLGRGSASSGPPQQLTLGAGLTISGTTLLSTIVNTNFATDNLTFTGNRTHTLGGNTLTIQGNKTRLSLLSTSALLKAEGASLSIYSQVNLTSTSASLTNTSPAFDYTDISLSDGRIGLSAPLGVVLNGSVGTAGQVFGSNGGSLDPSWQTVDVSTTNEGSLTLQAGTSTTSIISSNTSGSTPITIAAGTNITVAESGNTLTISSSAGGGPATAGGNPTEIQLNIGGVLGTEDSTVITQTPTGRLGLGKKTGLGAKLHIQSNKADESPAILVDDNTGKRVFNVNSYGGVVVGGNTVEGATGKIELSRWSDGQTYGTLWLDEADSVFTINANKNELKILSNGAAMMDIKQQGIAIGYGVSGINNPSAIMDFVETKKGLLIPRGNHTQRNLVPTPAQLLLYGNTSTGKLNYYNSGAWRVIADSASVASSLGNYLPITGGTLTGDLFFSADNTRDIGQVASLRPRTIYTATSFETAAGGRFNFASRGGITALGDGIFTLSNAASNDFGRLNIGGNTASFPSLKRAGTQILIRNGNDSGMGDLNAGNLVLGSVGSPISTLILDCQSTTKFMRPPFMSTAQRDAVGSVSGGSFMYNTTTEKLNYNTGSGWVEVGTGSGTVNSIVVGSSNISKGLSAVESPAGTYTIGLNLGAVGVISPMTAQDTSTYLITQRAAGFENSKVEVRNLVYDAYGEAYQLTQTNLGVLTSNVEKDLVLTTPGLNKLFNYNGTTGILKYNGTQTKVVDCAFNGTFNSTVVGDFWVRIYTAGATGAFTLLAEQKIYLGTASANYGFSLRRKTTLTQNMRVKVVVMQQPSGTAFCAGGTFSIDGVTTN